MKATVFQEHLEKNCRRCLELEPVFTRNICGFSSIILLQTRQKYAGGLSPGKCFSRSMQQNLPKRHVYTLVKTGSYIQKYVIDKKTGEWIEDISPDNTTKPNQALAHAWKCPYHNGRMCIEMVQRLSTAS